MQQIPGEMSKGQCGRNTAAFKVIRVRCVRLMSLVQQKRQWDKRKGQLKIDGPPGQDRDVEHGQIFGTNFRDPVEYYRTKLLNKVLLSSISARYDEATSEMLPIISLALAPELSGDR